MNDQPNNKDANYAQDAGLVGGRVVLTEFLDGLVPQAVGGRIGGAHEQHRLVARA